MIDNCSILPLLVFSGPVSLEATFVDGGISLVFGVKYMAILMEPNEFDRK